MENDTKSRFKLRLSIGNKIFGGFTILIVLFAVNAIIIFFTVKTINNKVALSSNVVNPSKDAINELVTLVHRSRMLITNWVFLQKNDDDKKALQYIISHEYTGVKEKLQKLMKS